SRMRAATPAAIGADSDVPLETDVAVVLPIQSEVIPEPGAKRSTHVPKFEYGARASREFEAPTVSAPGTRAGDWEQAGALSLPAATTVVIPAARRLLTSVSSAVDGEPPRLMFTTAGDVDCEWFCSTHSRPARIVEIVPLPEQSRTRTGTSVADFATP